MITLKAKIQQTVGDKIYTAEGYSDNDTYKDIEELVSSTKCLLGELIKR